MVKRGAAGREIKNDYLLLGKMSAELAKHKKNIQSIGRKVAKNKLRLDLKDGILENLEIVTSQMDKARKELDKARSKLKSI